MPKFQNVDVMDNTQKTKKSLVPASLVGVGAYALATASQAAIDTTAIETEIAGLAAPVAAIGAAILLILVGIKGWKLIRRAM